MCVPGQPPAPAAPASGPGAPAPATAAGAVAMAQAGLAGLAGLAAVDAAALTAAEQADCLRALEQAGAMHTAARAKVLGAFCAVGGYQDDGHGSAKTWLRWQARVTRGAATGAMGWMRRLAAHPAVADALAAGQISPSWARQVCAGSELLPAGCRAGADAILPAAVGQRAGPEDLRTTWQRRHDALEEACRRLLAANGVPDRAGQPAQIQLHQTLGQLRGQPGAAAAEADWAAGRAAAGPGADCDAAIVPVATGRLDHQVLDELAAALLRPQPGAAREDGAAEARRMRAERALILSRAADLLSGPGGLAAWLRARLPEAAAATVSLPLDTGGICARSGPWPGTLLPSGKSSLPSPSVTASASRGPAQPGQTRLPTVRAPSGAAGLPEPRD